MGVLPNPNKGHHQHWTLPEFRNRLCHCLLSYTANAVGIISRLRMIHRMGSAFAISWVTPVSLGIG